MAVIDVCRYKMRVILNTQCMRDAQETWDLVDLEGTVLNIDINDEDEIGNKFVKDLRLVELLCSNRYFIDAFARIRWDNDVKTYEEAGTLRFVRAQLNMCNNIWDSENIQINYDNRGIKLTNYSKYYTKMMKEAPTPFGVAPTPYKAIPIHNIAELHIDELFSSGIDTGRDTVFMASTAPTHNLRVTSGGNMYKPYPGGKLMKQKQKPQNLQYQYYYDTNTSS